MRKRGENKSLKSCNMQKVCVLYMQYMMQRKERNRRKTEAAVKCHNLLVLGENPGTKEALHPFLSDFCGHLEDGGDYSESWQHDEDHGKLPKYHLLKHRFFRHKRFLGQPGQKVSFLKMWTYIDMFISRSNAMPYHCKFQMGFESLELVKKM